MCVCEGIHWVDFVEKPARRQIGQTLDRRDPRLSTHEAGEFHGMIPAGLREDQDGHYVQG